MKGQKKETAAAPNRLEGIRTQRRRSSVGSEGAWPGWRIAFAHFIPGALEVDAHSHSYSAEELAQLPDNLAKHLTRLALIFREDLRTALAENDNRLANKLGRVFAPRQSAGKEGVVVRVDWFQTRTRVNYARDLEKQLAAVLEKLAENGDGAGVYAGDLAEEKTFGFTLWAGVTPAAKAPSAKGAEPKKLEEREELSHNEPVSRSTKPITAPPSLDEKVKALFAGLPDDPRERLAEIARIYSTLRKEAARLLHPSITALLLEAPALNYEQKASVAHQVNQVLLDARLAVLDPDTKLPAKLNAHQPRPTSAVSTLRLQDSRRGPGGRQHWIRVEELDLVLGSIELVETIAGGEQSPQTDRRPEPIR